MTQKEKYKYIIDVFETTMPQPETELRYRNPYELLVAVVLSAQCTDKRVNLITPELFKAFPNAKTLAESQNFEVFEYIKSCTYPNNKAKNLVAMAKLLHQEFDDVIPEKVEDLVKLPGVGRKTANVVASVVHGQPTFAVDTHVFRVSHRIGLVPKTATTPLAVEKVLVKNFLDDLIPKAHHWLILHGRYTCTARNPKCNLCAITVACTSFPKIQKAGIIEVNKALPKIH